jgi:flavodoxin
MDSYDVIYLGYPNWWSTFPMVVFTFLESYDFSGKTIVPFCTHEGSGLGSSEHDIKKLCQKADVKNGLAIRGSNVSRADNEIKNWIKENAQFRMQNS